MVPQY
jgi:hypothetical protein